MSLGWLMWAACQHSTPEPQETATPIGDTGHSGVDSGVQHSPPADTADTGTPYVPVDPDPPCLAFAPGVCVHLTGDEANDNVGMDVEARDVDGDGLVEVVVNEPNFWAYPPSGPGPHRAVYLLDAGVVSGPLVEQATASVVEPDLVVSFGYEIGLTEEGQLLLAADLNDDRYVSAFDVPTLLTGQSGVAGIDDRVGAIVTEQQQWLFGASPMVLTGCPTGEGGRGVCVTDMHDNVPGYDFGDWSGHVLVFSRPIEGDIDIHDYQSRFFGDIGERAEEVSGQDDLDGDGLDDLVIGAYKSLGNGQVAVLLDPPVGDHRIWDVASATIVGEVPGGDLGLEPVTGDVDGDGAAEVLLGAPIGSPAEAYAFVGPFSGERTTSSAEWRVSGANWLGYDQALGDFDGDGATDWAIGAPGSLFTDEAGVVYVFLAPERGVYAPADADAALESGVHVQDGFGQELEAGDFDGDGRDDLFVGAPRDPTVGPNSGALVILSGAGL